VDLIWDCTGTRHQGLIDGEYLTHMDYEQSRAEPCHYFAWTMLGLIFWVTWVDDCCVLGDEDCVKAAKEQMKSICECYGIGEFTEYVDYNIERTSNYV
jgi:hypothetical protein